MNLFSENDDGYAILCAAFISIGVIGAMVLSYTEHATPKPPITAERVGKAVGKTSTNFTKGFTKGVWDSIRGKKD